MKPLTRKEFFMAKAAGQTVPDLEPITREEYFLNQIAESGGGGGGGGVTIVPATASSDTGMITSSMKAGELYNAVGNGVVYLSISEEDYEALYGIIEAHIVEGRYSFAVASHGGMVAVLNASSSNEYPVYAGTPS